MKKFLFSVVCLLLLCFCFSCVENEKQEENTTSVAEFQGAKSNAKIVLNDETEKRITEIMSTMSLDEKLGQMTQLARDVTDEKDVNKDLLGSVFSGGGSAPRNNTVQGWQTLVSSLQEGATSTKQKIPIIYGVDSVHGNNTLVNSTIFPHNIALGAAGSEDLTRRVAKASALETTACGVHWTFAPCVAVLRDPRWGRCYESFGQDTELVTKQTKAFLEGWQGATESGITPIATAKHFLGDGNNVFGTSRAYGKYLDQGDMQWDENYIREVLLPPYKKAVESGVRTIMPSYSSWNGLQMHAHKYLITDVLKNELGFTGFVISDYEALPRLDKDYYKAIVIGINAGVDMNMVPFDGIRFVNTLKEAIDKGDISMERIDDAVRRILRVKIETGIFDTPVPGKNLSDVVRSPSHLALAREAVAKSLVVLKNDGILPLSQTEKKVYIGGKGANDIGTQCGGWTITWQGSRGKITEGTTILEAMKKAMPDTNFRNIKMPEIKDCDPDALCIVVTGEAPYAEYEGDSKNLWLEATDRNFIEEASEKFDRVVLVMVSGRPQIITNYVDGVDAIVEAWLPGTEADGIADILCGKVKPSGKLPIAWPKDANQLPIENFISGKEEPLFPFGYGLSW